MILAHQAGVTRSRMKDAVEVAEDAGAEGTRMRMRQVYRDGRG